MSEAGQVSDPVSSIMANEIVLLRHGCRKLVRRIAYRDDSDDDCPPRSYYSWTDDEEAEELEIDYFISAREDYFAGQHAMQVQKAEHLFHQLDAATASGLLASIPRSLFICAVEEYTRRQEAMHIDAADNLPVRADDSSAALLSIPRSLPVLSLVACSGPCNRIRRRSSMAAHFAVRNARCGAWAQRSAAIIVQCLGRVTWSMLVATLLFDAFAELTSESYASSPESFMRSVRRRVDY